MKKFVQSLFGLAAICTLRAGVSYAYPANLAGWLNWCVTNSGSIAVSYQECNGLAYLFDETSGVSRTSNTNRFSTTDLTTWAHPSGFLTGTFTIAGGHITTLDLRIGNLSGTITTGLLYLPYLTYLDLSTNHINSVDLSQNTGLLYLNFGNNNVTGFDVTMLTGLKRLSVGSPRLRGIDISQNVNLTGFVSNSSPVRFVDFSHNTGLQSISLAFDRLTGLDVAGLSNLTYLEAAYQSGASMGYPNLSGASSIYQLWLSDDGLTGIDLLPLGGALSILKLDGNHIAGISLTGNTSVGYVNLIGNSISSLDLSHNRYLSNLFLGNGNTGLTYLDLSYNTGELQIVDTSGIALTGFAISTTRNYPSSLLVYFTGNVFDVATLTTDQLRFLTQHLRGWGYRGLGGGKAVVIVKDNCPNGDNSPTQYDGLCSGTLNGAGGSLPAVTTGTVTTTGTIVSTGNTNPGTITPDHHELTSDTDVYNRAYAHGITTMQGAKARLNDPILRYEAAKMIVNFVKNVEGKTVTPNADCKIENFSDYNTFDAEMRTNIKAICDLGLMGRKPGKTAMIPLFRPFDTLSAQEFGIVIGRYLSQSASNPNSSQRVDIMRFLNSVSTQ